jgi:hypothetical protein
VILTPLHAFSGAENSEPDRDKAAYPRLFSCLVPSPPWASLPYERCNKLFLKTRSADIEFRRIPKYWGRSANQQLNTRYRSTLTGTSTGAERDSMCRMSFP